MVSQNKKGKDELEMLKVLDCSSIQVLLIMLWTVEQTLPPKFSP